MVLTRYTAGRGKKEEGIESGLGSSKYSTAQNGKAKSLGHDDYPVYIRIGYELMLRRRQKAEGRRHRA